MRTLTGVSITFDTHDDNKDDTTVVHVFVKNRLNSSLTPEQHGDYLSNRLDLSRYLEGDLTVGERNPYLAFGEGLGAGRTFDEGSSTTFALALTSPGLDIAQIMLPAVSIHILTDGDDQWIFDYTVTFAFTDESGAQSTIERSSVRDGLRGVVLDQDHHDHYRILAEGFGDPPVLDRPSTDAFLSRITLDLVTHGHDDDNKDFDTRLNVHIVNRLGATSAQDYAIGLDLFSGVEFAPNSIHSFSWSDIEGDGALAAAGIRLADVVLPVVYLVIDPNGHDRWKFDHRVTYEFTDPHSVTGKTLLFSSRTNGVVLDQDNSKHEGVYQGSPFPTVTPPTAPVLTSRPVDHVTTPKMISIPFLQRKLDEFVSSRTGSITDPNPPLIRLRLHNAGLYTEDTTPESYADVQSLVAGDGTLNYLSSPSGLGQFDFHYRLQDINSSSVTLSIDPSSVTPLTATVAFESDGPTELASTEVKDIDFLRFILTLRLTLDLARTTDDFGNTRTLVDLMSWVAEVEEMRQTMQTIQSGGSTTYHWKGTFLHQPVDFVTPATPGDVVTDFAEQVIQVSLTTGDAIDPQRFIRRTMVQKIYDRLRSADTLTGRTTRDGINAQVTSLLLGGIADDDKNTDQNNTVIHDVGIQNANPELGIPEDSIVISYTGPRNVFVPRRPSNWPAGHDFSPGRLGRIEHLVVLTMENRSFDHMLGYLSLPVAAGGQGRTDVDGLTGNESNPHQGNVFPTFTLTRTLFSPDPPHGHEPVHHAINGGRMDGFVKSFAEQHGDPGAGQIMGHHSAATVPVFDALARDFSIGQRWFASHPGPTFCNRFYELTGRLNLNPRGFWEFDNSSPIRPVFTETIFDHLTGAIDPITGKPVTWTYFEHGYCFLRFFEKYTFDTTNIVAADDPEFGFFAAARDGRLPSVSFIDPHFVELPPGGNSDGAPADVALGQDLVRRVVEAVVAGPGWDKTMLVIVYDEHGGFYDHVPPPRAAKISDDLPIDTYGVRVPAIVVSPWVRQGGVFGHDAGAGHPGALVFDHTSILKSIVRRFLSTAPPFMGARYATASDLSAVMTAEPQTPQFRPFIPYNLQFAASGLWLDVRSADPSPGAPLVQSARNLAAEQDFCFEDAGNGFVYVRSRVSNLYLTAGRTGSADSPAAVFQDLRYRSAPDQPPARRPALQRWRVNPVGVSVPTAHDHVIVNQAHPGAHLQPAVPGQIDSPVVLGPASIGSHGNHTIWKISSPLLPDEVTTHP